VDAHSSGVLIIDLAVVTGVAAVTSIAARRLGQSSILGYLFAGLIVGPYIPIPLFADPERITSLAEIGVVLVMFAVGLEFRLRRLVEILPLSGLTAAAQIGALSLAGYTVGDAMGWSGAASMSLGATLAISSTMVVSAVLRARPVDPDIRAHVFGVLVIQDVVAIVLMALVTTLASGEEMGLASLGRLIGQLSAVVLGMLVAGLLVMPRLVKFVTRRFDDEVLVVLVVGAAFGLASVAEIFGYSVALGAFIAGMAVAESGKGEKVEHAIEPLRALFAAVFFVSIGMTVDPRMAWQTLPMAIGLTAVVIGTHFVSVTAASLLTGSSLRKAVFSALTLGQIGELSFILATIGIGGGVLPEETLPALVTVATITAFTTPFLLGRAQPLVEALDRRIPARVQYALTAYQSFIRRGRDAEEEHPLRRAAVATSLDWAALLLLFVTYHWVGRVLPQEYTLSWSLAAALMTLPFLVGLIRSGRQLVAGARALARGGAPADDPTARTVEALAILAVALSIGVPTAALIGPIVATAWANATLALVLSCVIALVGARLRAVDSEYTSTVARLASRIAEQIGPAQEDERDEQPSPLAGFDYELLRVEPHSEADGATLVEINLRCKTGATVVAVNRGDTSTQFPTGAYRLQAGDTLAVSGSGDALARTRALLSPAPLAA
jgi:CPA2 family monovalent cation:H+ antiporter-2